MKEKLLYVSPFWPCKSGISEYSEVLIGGLLKYFDVTLLTDGYLPSDQSIIKRYEIIKNYKDANFADYAHILYNFGNNPMFHLYMYEMLMEHPGYVILHDYVLYYLTIGYYMQKNMLYQKIYELEGVNGINRVKRSLSKNTEKNLLAHKWISAELPMNKEVISKAEGIFVHSLYSRDKILTRYPNKKVFKIPIPQLKVSLNKDEQEKGEQQDFLRKKFSFKKKQYIVGSIGLIAPSKQNELVCQAVKMYNNSYDEKIAYVMCGDGDYVDKYLDENIVKTGFLENEDFFRAISSCDMIVNLRFPYNGEASATLIQCMDMGKKCIATDIGWFSELPNDIVMKVPVDITSKELCDYIVLMKSKQFDCMGKKAHEYVESKCNAGYVAEQIFHYLEDK